MATQRFNYNDKFRLNGKKVGISSASPEENLDVASGTLKGVDLQSNRGITTFSTYEGFLNKKTTYTENVQIDTGVSGSLSGEIVVGAGLTVTVGTAATSGQGDVECLKVFNVFNPPCGGTANRPSAATPGTLYYNKDFRTIEYWDGSFWRQVDNTTRSGRAVVGGGSGSFYTSKLQTFNISTLGNAIKFGDLTNDDGTLRGRFSVGPGSDGIRGIFAGGQDGPSTPRNYIDQITMASEGNSVDFGDLSSAGRCFGGCGSSTRGIFGGINAGNECDTIQYATKGSTVSSFLTLSIAGGNKVAMFSSPVKLISRNGESSSAANGSTNVTQNQSIETASIASGGTTTFFGTLSRNTRQVRGTCNNTRGMFFGGYRTGSPYYVENHIDYITISSNGNAIDFGDLTSSRAQSACTAHSTRAVAAGGGGDPVGTLNVIDYVTIQSKGNASDFGDLFFAVSASSACSDSNGGVGGF